MPTRLHKLRTMRDRPLCFSHGTTYGHKHGWDTLATQCGRSTPSHAPTEHGTRPTTTWDDYPAMETMHSTAQPRQHGPDRAPKAQAHTPSGEHHKALANDGRTDAHKHAATASGARQHAGHAGHQARAARTQNPCPPACCRPICLQRRSRLAGQRGEDGDCAREDGRWRGG